MVTRFSFIPIIEIATGPIRAIVVSAVNEVPILQDGVAPDDVEHEVDRLNLALKTSAEELRLQMAQAEETLGKETAEVFGFHLGMLQDPTLTKPIRQRIREQCITAEYAVSLIFEELVQPKLIQPVFILDYPLAISPLAKMHRDRFGCA